MVGCIVTNMAAITAIFKNTWLETAGFDMVLAERYLKKNQSVTDYIQLTKEKKDIAETHRKNAESRLQEAEAREVKLLKDIEKSKGGKDEIELIRNQHISELDKIRAEYQEKENHQIQNLKNL